MDTIEQRFPIWKALSNFFLDNQLQDVDYEYIAKTLAQSKYSIQELQDILYYEVYPACKSNLRSIAGEWAGFSKDWIMEYIAPRMNKRPFIRLPIFGKWMFQRHWDRVVKMIEEKRKLNT